MDIATINELRTRLMLLESEVHKLTPRRNGKESGYIGARMAMTQNCLRMAVKELEDVITFNKEHPE